MNEKQIDYIIDLIVDGKSAEAVWKLLTLRKALAEAEIPRPTPDNEWIRRVPEHGTRNDRTEAALPKVKPVTGHKLKTIDVFCPTCKAKPGQGCWQMTTRGPHGKPTTEKREHGYHKPRVAKARKGVTS